MKALTLHPEQAELFRHGLRNVETRGWATKHRGPILLHAGMRDPDSAAARRDPLNGPAMAAIPHGQPLTRGAGVAVGDLVDCVPMRRCWAPRQGLPADGELGWVVGWDEYYVDTDPPTWAGGPGPDSDLIDVTDQTSFGVWSVERTAWIIRDIRPLPEPVPCRGAQGLWMVPDAVATAVMAQLAKAVVDQSEAAAG